MMLSLAPPLCGAFSFFLSVLVSLSVWRGIRPLETEEAMRRFLLAACAVLCVWCPAVASAEVWGAVAINNTGVYSSTWNRDTKESALDYVKANCARADNQDCNVMWAEGSAWIAAVHCDSGNQHWGLPRWGKDAKDAIARSYHDAIKGGFAKRDCKLRVIVAGDGSHLKFKK